MARIPRSCGATSLAFVPSWRTITTVSIRTRSVAVRRWSPNTVGGGLDAALRCASQATSEASRSDCMRAASATTGSPENDSFVPKAAQLSRTISAALRRAYRRDVADKTTRLQVVLRAELLRQPTVIQAAW